MKATTKIFRILKNNNNKKCENEIKENTIEDTEILLGGIFVRFQTVKIFARIQGEIYNNSTRVVKS